MGVRPGCWREKRGERPSANEINSPLAQTATSHPRLDRPSGRQRYHLRQHISSNEQARLPVNTPANPMATVALVSRSLHSSAHDRRFV